MQGANALVIDHERSPSPVRLVHSRPARSSTEWTDRSFNDIRELCDFLSIEIRTSGLKFVKIAERANCHPTTVAHLARNETASPRAATVFQVLRALGFEVLVRG